MVIDVGNWNIVIHVTICWQASRDALRLVDFAIRFSYSICGDRAANRMLNCSIRSASGDVLRRRVILRREMVKSLLLESSRRMLHIVKLGALVEVL